MKKVVLLKALSSRCLIKTTSWLQLSSLTELVKHRQRKSEVLSVLEDVLSELDEVLSVVVLSVLSVVVASLGVAVLSSGFFSGFKVTVTSSFASTVSKM